LNILINLGVHKTEPRLTIDVIRTIIDVWNERPKSFSETETHYFKAVKESKKSEVPYEDSSILPMFLVAACRVGKELKDALCSAGLYEILDNTLQDMFDELEKSFYKNGLWTDASGRFSIYMTERVLEALLAYAEYLGPPPMDLTQIGEKINTVIEAVGKVSRSGDEILGRLDALDRRMSSIEAAVNEIKELFSKLEAKIVDKIVERARSGSEEIEAIERVKKHAPKRK